MLKRSLTLAVSLLCGGALAQLSYNGVGHGAVSTAYCNVTQATQSTNVAMGSPSIGTMNVSLVGQTSAVLQRSSGVQWEAKTTTYFSFGVGSWPVLLSSVFGALDSHHNGKHVLGGGALANAATTMRTQCNVLWQEFVDADADGVYDIGTEDAYLIESTAVTMTTTALAGNGYEIYDFHPTWGTPQPYVLGAQRHYLLQIDALMWGDLNDSPSDPFHVATHEYNNPFSGWDLTYTYQAVPEPATFAGLGAAFVALASRRKKKTSILSK